MVRYVRLSLVCVACFAMQLACAPKWLGPTATSGYSFSLHGSDTTIVLPLSGGASREYFYPRVAELRVTVKDAQGQPVDGIPVTFQIEPKWVQDATITPQRAMTRNGVARAILKPETIGVVQVIVSVENMTETLAITVSAPSTPSAAGD